MRLPNASTKTFPARYLPSSKLYLLVEVEGLVLVPPPVYASIVVHVEDKTEPERVVILNIDLLNFKKDRAERDRSRRRFLHRNHSPPVLKGKYSLTLNERADLYSNPLRQKHFQLSEKWLNRHSFDTYLQKSTLVFVATKKV